MTDIVDDGYDMPLPDRFKENKEFYALVSMVFIPLMTLGGFWYSSMVYGALILSSLSSLMYLDVILQYMTDSDGEEKVAFYSLLLVFFSAWGPLAFLITTPYRIVGLGYTSLWFSIGNYSIIKKYSVWRDFWKNGFKGIFNSGEKNKTSFNLDNKDGDEE